MMIFGIIILYLIIGRITAEAFWYFFDEKYYPTLIGLFLFPEWYGSENKSFGKHIGYYNQDFGIENYQIEDGVIYKANRILLWPFYILANFFCLFIIASPTNFINLKTKAKIESQDRLSLLYSEKIRIETEIEEHEKELGIGSKTETVYRIKKTKF